MGRKRALSDVNTADDSSSPEKRPEKRPTSQETRTEETIVPKPLSTNERHQHLYRGDRNSPSESRTEGRFPILLTQYPLGKTISDTVAFLNQVMKDEELLDKHTPKAIISHHCRDSSGHCVLEMANPEVQKKICWLSSIPWSGFGIINVGRDWTGSVRPQYTSYAVYKAHGDVASVRVYLCNPPTNGKQEIRDFFNAKLWEYGLARRDEFGVLRYKHGGLGGTRVGVLEVASSKMREKLLYLNGVGGWKDPAYRFVLCPHQQYTGPPPKYRHFKDFLKDFENKTRRLDGQLYGSLTSNRNKYDEHMGRRNDDCSYTSNPRCVHSGYCENKLSFRHLDDRTCRPFYGSPNHKPHCNNRDANSNDRFRQTPNSQPNRRSGSNGRESYQRRDDGPQNGSPSSDAKSHLSQNEVIENEELKKRVAQLEKLNNSLTQNLTEKTEAAKDFQSQLNSAKKELATTQNTLNNVHTSWQEQTREIASKDAQIAELQGCVSALKTNVGESKRALDAQSQALLDETMKRRATGAILDQFQIENMKQQARLHAAISALQSTDPMKELQNESVNKIEKL